MTDENTPPDPGDIPVEVETPSEAAPAADDAAHLKEETAKLEQEKKELYERLLRTAADFDNFRKRAGKDLENARFSAREQVLRDVLPVLDNLERAVAAGGASAQAVLDGIKLVLRQAEAALERFDVKWFASVGQAFDPARHEAIAQVESAGHPAGTVVSEMQKGYTLGGRLLRPALVAVSKAPPEPPPPQEPAETATENE